MHKQPLVSIIVPVYNVEKYIERCLDSIVSQTYRNLQIIVVNDGSPDNSEIIIEQFKKNDNRIVYIKRQNGGLGAARNTGLEAAKGEYVCFIDSDDWVSKQYVERLVQVLLRDDSQIAVCNMIYIFSDYSVRPRTPKILSEDIITAEQALRKEFIGKEYRFHAPNKFCKRSLFEDNNIRFSEGKLYEDIMTTYKLFLAAKKVSLLPYDLYFYFQGREGSIMSKEINQQRFKDMYLALREIESNKEIQSLRMETEIDTLFAINIISLTNYIYPLVLKENKKNWISYRNMILNPLYIKHMKRTEKNKLISRIIRFRVMMIRKHFFVYCLLMKIIKKI